MNSKISVTNTLSKIPTPWTPKIVARVDDAYDVKVAKLDGPFIWHSHEDADELFYLLSGSLKIEIEGSSDIDMTPGDVFVVPKGVRHRPVAVKAEIILLEKVGVVNTGEEQSDLTVVPEDLRGNSKP